MLLNKHANRIAAKIEASDNNDWTALHYAAHDRCLKLLLKKDVNTGTKTNAVKTALDLCK